MEMDIYEKVFKELDTDHDGKISRQDLKHVLEKSGLAHDDRNEVIELFFLKNDANDDEHISYDEFLIFMGKARKHLEELFNSIDSNGDGVVGAEELMNSCKHLDGFRLQDAVRIINKIDRNGSHTISLQEFCEYYMIERIESYIPNFLAMKRDFLREMWRYHPIIDLGAENIAVPALSEDAFEDHAPRSVQISWWQHHAVRQLGAGLVAGAVSRTSTAPMDRLKTIMQAKSSSQYRIGILDGFRHMLKEGGLRCLWRGNGVNVLKIAPETALKFMMFEEAKAEWKRRTGKQDLLLYERFACGSLAGATAQTCIFPLEVVKTRLALSKTGEYRGIVDCLVSTVSHEGPRALFKGYLPNLIGILLYAGTDLSCYESFKRLYTQQYGIQHPAWFVVLGCGAASSCISQLVTYPFALVRTKMQAQAHSDGHASETSMIRLGRSIVRSDGLIGFYRGILPNYLKVVPAVSISYMVYESTRRLLGLTE